MLQPRLARPARLSKIAFAALSLVLGTMGSTPPVAARSTPAAQQRSKQATPAIAPGASAQIYLTARDSGQRLSAAGSATFVEYPQPDEASATVLVDPTVAFQRIEGIGGALTDAAAETFDKLPAAQQAALIRAYYDPSHGIGYTLARTHINSCDFSSASYAYVEQAGDTSLSTFSIAHDREHRIPFIRRILKVVPTLKIFASPWSPPAWMKSNHSMLDGGTLLPRYRDAWARYYVRFVQEYAREGIPIWGLTVQNEPMARQTWESCIYTGKDEAELVKGFLGPALHRAGLDHIKLMIWDHNRGLLYQRAQAVLADAEAARYVWGTAVHWYLGEQFETQTRVHEAFPDKALLFSEGCGYPFSWENVRDWVWGERYARSMIGDFNSWMCGWTDWNVLLDERGGPNHVGNYCLAPIIADTRTGTLHMMSSYYYIGHFSKFVRPGAHRIACTTTRDDLQATAFKNPDGRICTVVLNATDQPRSAQVWIAGLAAPVKLPAHSIATVVWSSPPNPVPTPATRR
jgi:glucosylceramidase